jgi:hypothetical protein
MMTRMGTIREVIGMVHLRPLPGSPTFAGDFESVVRAAVDDARTLAQGGIDAIMIENFGDIPFYRSGIPAATVAAMSVAAAAVRGAIRSAVGVPIGINCLRNDGCAAMSIAAATGAAFIRVNVLTGARVTDQGVIEGCAADLLRLRANLGARAVRILADVDVKHSAPLADRPVEEEVWDMIERGGADALIVSGTGTGRPADPELAQRVKRAAPNTPLYIGSGVSADTAQLFDGCADGLIVGTSLKVAGQVHQPVDPARVRALMSRIRS